MEVQGFTGTVRNNGDGAWDRSTVKGRYALAAHKRAITRTERRRIAGNLRLGALTVNDVLVQARADDWYAAGMLVSHVLAALPGVHDAERVKRLLDEVAAHRSTTLRQLTPGQRARLLAIGRRHER